MVLSSLSITSPAVARPWPPKLVHIFSLVLGHYYTSMVFIGTTKQHRLAKHALLLLGDVPDSPALTYSRTYNEILVSWSPVGVCGPVTYNITVMPSHGIMMMINNTVYNNTGLNYNTNYTITVYATNSHGGHGEPATVTVRTKYPPPGSY